MDWGNFCLLVGWSVCIADSCYQFQFQWHKLLSEYCGRAMHLCGKCKLVAYLNQNWFSVISDFGDAEEKVWSWFHRLGLGRQLIPCSDVSEPVGHLPLSKGGRQPQREKQKLQTNLPHFSSKLFSIASKTCFWEEGLLYPHAGDAWFSFAHFRVLSSE